jgi:anti-sigma B factor antagonist
MQPRPEPDPSNPAAPVFAATVDLTGHTTLVVTGEIDLASTPALRELMEFHLRQAGRSGLDLDLSRVRFFSAAGVRALLDTTATARRDGTRLHVTALSPEVEQVIELTGTQVELDLARPTNGGTSNRRGCRTGSRVPGAEQHAQPAVRRNSARMIP